MVDKVLQAINELSYEYKDTTEMLISIGTLRLLKKEIESLRDNVIFKEEEISKLKGRVNFLTGRCLEKEAYMRFDKRI